MQNRLTGKLFFLLLFFFFYASLRANFTKSVQGYVRDSETAEPVIGATVRVKGTTTGTNTDIDGYYALQDLADGKYTLEFRLLSYKTLEIECETKDTITRLDVLLDNDDILMDEVVVSARMHSNTETAMLTTVKSLPQVTSGISAAQIIKSPDRAASEVVRRIPGVTIIDDRFIIVRGLAQRYNNAWINGLAVPSTETDSRAFPLDLVPSSQIDHLLVYKSPSPEIPGDFSGGFVKITSKGVPDENRMEFSYTTGFNTQTHGNNFRMNPGSATDCLGFDGNKRALANDFPAHSDMAPGEISRLTKTGFNNDWRIKSFAPFPDQRFSLMIARRKETAGNKTIGNITALTYSNTLNGVEGMKNARYGIYSARTDMPVFLDNYYDNRYSNDVRLGVLHNYSFVPNPFHRIEFKNLLNILGRNRLTERTGVKDMSSMYYREQTEILYSSRLTYSGQFSGVHDLSPGRTLTWDAGYSYAGKNEPDRRIVTNQAGVGSIEDIPVPTDNESINRYFQDLHDHTASVAMNFKRIFREIPFKPTLKTGIYGEYRHRGYSVREFIYRYDNLTYDERQSYLKLPFEEMLSGNYLDEGKVYIDEITRKTNNYTASVWHGAGYLALEIPLNKLLIYTGVRFENHYTKLLRDRSDAPELILMTDREINDRDFLPSLNLTYKFSEKQQLRAAYGRSVNRPELRELSPTVYFDFDLFSEIGGNENLKRANIDNLDLRYEFYPAFGETVSFGLFYKYFRNPIEWTFIDMGGSLRYHYENAEAAKSWGIELDVRKKLDFTGIRGFSLVLNAALIESRVHFKPGEIVSEPDRPMQGQSPYAINAGLYYQSENRGLHVSLLYNRIGKRIVGLGKSNSIHPDINTLIPDSYEMPRNTLDFTIGKSIGKNLELRCSVRDILSEAIVYKQFPKFEKDGVIHNREQITRQYNPGQSISVGVALKIN
ncbi:MAG: TonB-dependent receptor [Dysgonamonadaceae bacterium]|jgi:outer membrane receptor protein involved in Fe transport|nr:TonB-dependent receptor [Dysgonamonadaceae bacterium]